MINLVHVRVVVRTYKSSLCGIALNALLLLVLRPFALTRFLRRISSIGSYVFNLINDGTVGGNIRIASSNTSISSAMFLILLVSVVRVLWILNHAFNKFIYVIKPLNKHLTAWLVNTKAHFSLAFFNISLANTTMSSFKCFTHNFHIFSSVSVFVG